MRSIIDTTRTGCAPEAVSAESITASDALNTAVATSETSARVGWASLTMLSSICVATIVGLAAARPSSSRRSWAIGTVSGSSSTPRSPRATMIPSEAATISSMFSIASGFSIFEISLVREPSGSIARSSARSEPRRTNDSAR